jgi:hypothetical protein
VPHRLKKPEVWSKKMHFWHKLMTFCQETRLKKINKSSGQLRTTKNLTSLSICVTKSAVKPMKLMIKVSTKFKDKSKEISPKHL